MTQENNAEIIFSGPGIIQSAEFKQRVNDLLAELVSKKSPNQRDEIIDELIKIDDETGLMNALSRVADYPRGVSTLTEAIIIKQERENKVGALVWLLEHSQPVTKAPKLKYAVVRSIILSGNTKAITHIMTLSTIREVPLLVKALESRSISTIDDALARFAGAN